MAFSFKRIFQAAVPAAMITMVATSCAPKPESAVSLPPPTPTLAMRPYPPMGAAPNLTIPPKSVDGSRLTINSNLSPEQATWNLRSAYNVAALNCLSPKYSSIVTDYGNFLKTNQKTLRDINNALEMKFKAEYGRTYIAQRELFQTQVYNYFALPPTIPVFCDAALAVGQELKGIAPGDLVARAPFALSQLESVFTDFFDRYDQYRRDFAQWQIDFTAKYGTPPADGYFLPGEKRYQPQQQTMTQTFSQIPAGASIAGSQ